MANGKMIKFGPQWRLVNLKVVDGDGPGERKRVEDPEGVPCLRGAIDGNADYASSGIEGVAWVVFVSSTGKELAVPWSPDEADVEALIALIRANTKPREKPVPEPVSDPVPEPLPDAPSDALIEGGTVGGPGETAVMTDDAAAALLGAGTADGGTGPVLTGQPEDDTAVPIGVLEEPGPDDGPPTAEFKQATVPPAGTPAPVPGATDQPEASEQRPPE